MTFKMPTGKELAKMLDQLSEKDKKEIRQQFEKDVERENMMHYTAKMLAQEHAKRPKMLFKYTEGLKEMLQEIRKMPDNAPIFPINMCFYYEQDVYTVYRILNELEREKIVRSMLFMQCNKCGYEMLFDSIGDVDRELICPNCKTKIYLPNWGELQVVYRRIRKCK